MLTPLHFRSMHSFFLTVNQYSSTQALTPPGTTLILVGALLLVLIILGGVLWVARRRK